jgi:hypothetical protein
MSDSKFQLSRVAGARVSDPELLADIRRVADALGTNRLTQEIYSKHGTYYPRTLQRHFGSWNKALKAAGLELNNEQNISDERLFENLMRVWEHYGRQPRLEELNRSPSSISGSTYQRRFRSWFKALTQFVAYANAIGAEQPKFSDDANDVRTSRAPSLRLRFRILKRDNFTCRACGASPALTFGLALHVDHIKAWSLGGETTENNLQTLCEKCNLGKSNVL